MWPPEKPSSSGSLPQDGVKTIVFEGQAWANEVNLVAVGTLSLPGRGPYEGAKLELAVEEIGPGTATPSA